MSRLMLLPVIGCLAVWTGCLSVDTPDVRVSVLSPPPPQAGAAPEPTRPYAEALDRVMRQQDKVAKPLSQRDWEEVLDEAGDWVKYVRNLSGYAETSHDPARFRRCCDELLKATEAVRQAARAQDAQRCARAIDACDPLLDQFARTFPLTGPPPSEKEAPAEPAEPAPHHRVP